MGPRERQYFQTKSVQMTGAAWGPLESKAQFGQAPGALPSLLLTYTWPTFGRFRM